MIKQISVFIFMAVILLSGCGVDMTDAEWEENAKGEPVTLGDLKAYHSKEALAGQERLDVTLNIAAANIDVSKGDNLLYETKITTNGENLKPRIDYRDERLDITYDRRDRQGVHFNIGPFKRLDDFVNDWDVQLTGDIPMSLDIVNNASKADYDLTDMTIESLTMDLNACDANINFDETNRGALDKMVMDLNAGNAKMTGLSHAKIRDMDIDMNAGNLLLYFDDSLQSDVTMDIEVNVGNITIDVPEDSGISIKKKSALLSVDIDRLDFKKITKDEYKSKNYEEANYKLYLNLRGNAANVTLK